MTAGRARAAVGLVDVIDRILDRGLVVNADVIISLAGVPLIGLRLRAALAGMETMTRYGVMQDWDRRIRALASEHPGAGPAPRGGVAAAARAVEALPISASAGPGPRGGVAEPVPARTAEAPAG